MQNIFHGRSSNDFPIFDGHILTGIGNSVQENSNMIVKIGWVIKIKGVSVEEYYIYVWKLHSFDVENWFSVQAEKSKWASNRFTILKPELLDQSIKFLKLSCLRISKFYYFLFYEPLETKANVLPLTDSPLTTFRRLIIKGLNMK